jgi:hypothetical protein
VPKLELNTPRYTTFDADLLAAYAQPFPVWPTADEPRRFDRDACVDLAARVCQEFWSRHEELDPLFPERDGALSRDEAAFWFGLFSTNDISNPKVATREWIEAQGARFDGATPQSDLAAALEDSQINRLSWAIRGYLLRAARGVLPWSAIYGAAVEQLGLRQAGYDLKRFGYCPAEQREAALAIAREHTEWIPKDQWINQGVFRARAFVPDAEAVEAALEAAATLTNKSDYEALFELCLLTPDHARLDRFVREQDFIWERKHVQLYVARRGLGDLEAMLAQAATARSSTVETLSALEHVKAPEVVAQLHQHTLKGGERAEIAQRILEGAELEHAAHGLLASCARAGKRRTWAIERLRELVERDGGRDALEAALPQQRKKLADFVRAEVLEHDDEVERVALDDAPPWAQRFAKLAADEGAPIWLSPDQLPDVVLADSGLALPTECVTGMVVADTHAEHRADLAAAKKSLTPGSLVALSNALMTQWFQADKLAEVSYWRQVQYARPLTWVRAHPSPAGVALLEQYIRATKPPNRYQDADSMVDLAVTYLGQIDMPEAIAATLRVASVGRRDEIRRLARKALTDRETRLEVARPELEDLAVPTYGLDELGRRDFDYGARTIRMFVSGGDLLFEDLSKGKVTRIAPKGLKSDDVDKVVAARAVFDVTVKPIRSELAEQQVRLEEAMIWGREWSGRWWRERWWRHPLLGPMSRGLIWQVWRGDQLVATMRPTEDGGFIDTDFDEHTVEDADTLTLPHPVDLGADAVKAWTEHMLEFEHTQPFDQLSRDTFTREDALDEVRGFLDGEYTLDPKTLRALARKNAGTFHDAKGWTNGTWTYPGRQGPVDLRLQIESGKGKNAPLKYANLQRVYHQLRFGDLHDATLSEFARLMRLARSG